LAESNISSARSLSAARIVLVLLALLALPCVSQARAAQTVVSLTFDDGIKTQADLARPLLASHGMHGTFYINSGNVGANSYYMSWSQVDALAAGGNEIGGHTLTHQKLTDLTADQQRHQICDDRTALQNRGYTVTDFAYPYGAGQGDTTTRSIVTDCGYKSARKVGGIRDKSDCPKCPYAESIPPVDALSVSANPYVTGPITLAKLQGWVTQAEGHGGGWVPLMFHDICNKCYDASVSQSVLSSFLDWLKARSSKGTVVKTVAEVIGGGAPPPHPPPGDTTPPTTTISCNGVACPSTALSAPVSIGLSASDSGSGVAATRYTTDGTDPTSSSTTYTAPFQISATTTIKYRSWDVAGNVEQVRSQTVNVTSSGGGGGPSVVITSPAAGATVSGNVTVVANATGTGTSPDVDLYVDGNFTSWRSNNVNPYQIPWNTGTATVGSHTINVWVTDTLGTITKSAPVTVTVTR
jgi:peptidoglycan/xylan/chitin deacetylase (PgdA/CDA1 family)